MPTIVDSATFLIRYPEFSEIDVARIDVFLDDAEADTSETFFGTTHARAISALAAHRMAVQLDEDGNAVTGQAGALSQASADGVSSTFVIPDGLPSADTLLWSTVYGQAFLEIRNNRGPAITVAC